MFSVLQVIAETVEVGTETAATLKAQVSEFTYLNMNS